MNSLQKEQIKPYIKCHIAAVIDKSKDGIFILSDKSEKELIDDYGGQSWIVPLGIILSGIGLSLILKSVGVFLSEFN